MGGRGRSSNSTNQINIQEIFDRVKINKIIEESEEMRKDLQERKNSKDNIKFKICVCCKSHGIPINSLNYECPICGWIDSKYQNNNINSLNGPNHTTLRNAQRIWRNK